MTEHALDIVSVSPLRTASVLWQPRRDVFVLTLVAKATYALAPVTAELASEQEYPNEEENHWNDDPARSVHSPSDLAPLKPRAEVLLVGHAFAPRGERARSLVARMLVGEVDKSIEVFGDRSFAQDGSLREGSPFSRVPLRYERAAGGPDTDNPVGMRSDVRDSYGAMALPNLQPPGLNVTSPSDFIAPAGFGPIASSWTTRRARRGPGGSNFSDADLARAPMPEQLDPLYFMAAPLDQQLPALRADERIVLENLHPDHPRLVTSLPGIEPRAFVERPGAAPQELHLVPDTLWIDTDRALCTVTWRAPLSLEHPQARGRILVGAARMGWPLTWADLEGQTRRAQGPPRVAGYKAASPPVSMGTPAGAAPHTPPRDRDTDLISSQAQGPSTPRGRQMTPSSPSLPFVEPENKHGTQPPPSLGSAVGSPPGAPVHRKAQTLVFAAHNKPVEESTPALDASPSWLRGPRPSVPSTPPSTPSAPIFGASFGTGARPATPDSGPPLGETLPIVRNSPGREPPVSTPWAPAPVPQPAPMQVPAPVLQPINIPQPAAVTVGQKAAAQVLATPQVPTAAQNGSMMGMDTPRPEVVRPAAVSSDIAKLGAVAASNAAAGPPDAFAPRVTNGATAAPVAPTRPKELVDLLWFEPSVATRLRAATAFRDLLGRTETDAWITSERTERDMQDDQADRDRRDVMRVLNRAEPFDLARIDRAVEDAYDADGAYAPPLAVTSGDLVFRFDEREALKATITSVAPLIGADKKLRDLVTEATDALKGDWPLPDDVADGFTRRVEQAFGQMPRAVASGYLQGSVDKLLLEGRHYRKKSVFSDARIRAELACVGAEPIPTYLPVTLALRLPLFARFRCVMIVELRTQEDQHETHPQALLALAVARVLDRRR